MLDKLSARCSREPEVDRLGESSVVFQIAAENMQRKFSPISPHWAAICANCASSRVEVDSLGPV